MNGLTKLTELKNIGTKSASWLEAVGIHSAEQLFEISMVEAYRRTKAAFPERVSLNLLYALQGALLNLPWNEIPASMKAQLQREAGENDL